MDEKDRVFARFKDEQTEATDRHERLTLLRPARASGSRVVEVVRVRSAAPGTDRPRRVDTQLRAAFWDDGFPAKRPASAAFPADLPAAGSAETVVPVAHVMPARPAALRPPVAEVAPVQAEEPATTPKRGPGRPRKAILAQEPVPPSPSLDIPAVAAAEPPVALRRGRGRPRKDALGVPTRTVADPFDADDDRANCMRCGYAMDPLRERRGMMTCAACG